MSGSPTHLLVAVIVVVLASIAWAPLPSVAGNFSAIDLAKYRANPSDEGTRRRLEGCWALPRLQGTWCFDGSDHTELTINGDPDQARPGTYTVIAGRAFFDLSPDQNPASEIYASCTISIGLGDWKEELEFDGFAFQDCAHWNALQLGVQADVERGLRAERKSSSWLLRQLYDHPGTSILDAPLNGCWDMVLSRDRLKTQAEMTAKFGGWLASYRFCFDGNRHGKTYSQAADGFDGWDSEGRFEFVGGRLALRDEGPGASEERCEVVVRRDRLSMRNCALWGEAANGRMVAIHASEPSEYLREKAAP